VTELVELEIEERGDVVVARVSGELDIAGAQRLGDQIHEAVPTSAHALVVDFTGLDFIDSSGIAMLFGLARRLGSKRQELRVVARSGKPVARVLQLVEFDRAAPVHETLDDALEAAAG
jgi:anti-anti-sigma factor